MRTSSASSSSATTRSPALLPVHVDEVKHFGVAVEEWGSGLAVEAHDELMARLSGAGVRRVWLCVYAANPRGRAFWTKLGWTDTGERSSGPMPPHAELLDVREAAQRLLPLTIKPSTSSVDLTSPYER